MRLIVGISGATGAIYGVRLLEVLHATPSVESHLILTTAGKITVEQETSYSARDVEALAAYTYDNGDIGAAIASGSFRTEGMVILPCSIRTAAALATCSGDGLLCRAAMVTLKEGRRLIVGVRETPLHLGHLRQLTALAEMGAVVFPPLVAFHRRPTTLTEVIDHTVGSVLDRMGIANPLSGECTGSGEISPARR